MILLFVNVTAFLGFSGARLFWPGLSPFGEHAIVIGAICYTALVSFRSPNTVGICALILVFHLVDIFAQSASYMNAYLAYLYYIAIDGLTAAALLFRVPIFRNRLSMAFAKFTLQDFIAASLFFLGAVLAVAGFVEHVIRHLDIFYFLCDWGTVNFCYSQEFVDLQFNNSRWVMENFSNIKMFLNNMLLLVLFSLTLNITRKEVIVMKV